MMNDSHVKRNAKTPLEVLWDNGRFRRFKIINGFQ